MSKQADPSSLSASSPLAVSSSTVVLPSAAESSNAPKSDPSLVCPCYYLERPDGTLTALVEVDQLPEHVRIRGLSRKLSIADTTGMTSVGIREGGQRKYTVEIADVSANFHHRGEQPSNASATKNTGHENASVTIAATQSIKAPSDTITVLNDRASTFTPTCTGQETVIPKPIIQNGKKVYCTYWIARGECHYAQQGCKFKHEMPNLEILEKIMGRRSFPKWWLESIGLVSAPPSHLRHIATNDRQQGKRRATIPKSFALPAPANMHMNSSSALAPPSTVAPALPQGFSANMFVSSPKTSVNKIADRKDGGVNFRSYVSVESGSNMQSLVAGPGGSNIRTPFTRPSGGNNTRSSIAGPNASASTVHAPISGTVSSNSIITQHRQHVPEIRSTDLGSNSNISPLIPGLSGHIVTNANQAVSNVRSPHDPSRNGSNMIHIKQPVNNERSTVSGTMSNTASQITNQPNNSLTTPTSPAHQTAGLNPLRIKIPRKYTPPFRIAVLPTLSTFHSPSSATSRPRVNLPASRSQDIVPSGLGNRDGGNGIVSSTFGGNASANGGQHENRGAGRMEGGLNEGSSAYYTSTTTGVGGSRTYRGSQTTRPYDEVFDLLGPF